MYCYMLLLYVIVMYCYIHVMALIVCFMSDKIHDQETVNKLLVLPTWL